MPAPLVIALDGLIAVRASECDVGHSFAVQASPSLSRPTGAASQDWRKSQRIFTTARKLRQENAEGSSVSPMPAATPAEASTTAKATPTAREPPGMPAKTPASVETTTAPN